MKLGTMLLVKREFYNKILKNVLLVPNWSKKLLTLTKIKIKYLIV